MIAIGCLALIILPLIGLAIGGYVGGPHLAMLFAVIGFVLAIAVCAVSALALAKAGRR